MKKYIISEEHLLELLEAKATMEMLEQAGVDNWWGFCENRIEYIAGALNMSEDEVNKLGLDLEDVAQFDLLGFETL